MSQFTQVEVDAHNAKVARFRGGTETLRKLADDLCPEGEEIETLHRPACKWLTERGIAFVYNRPDKKSTATLGAPDFVIAAPMGNVVFVEFKTRTGKLSPAQRDWHYLAMRARHEVLVLRSMIEFVEAMRFAGIE